MTGLFLVSEILEVSQEREEINWSNGHFQFGQETLSGHNLSGPIQHDERGSRKNGILK